MPESNNLLGMMLEQAKHEVFSDNEILDETVMFYAVCTVSPADLVCHEQSTRRATTPRQ